MKVENITLEEAILRYESGGKITVCKDGNPDKELSDTFTNISSTAL